MDDPLYFIQQAMTLTADLERSAIDIEAYITAAEDNLNDFAQFWPVGTEKYSNVTINIWLFKGSHHFV